MVAKKTAENIGNGANIVDKSIFQFYNLTLTKRHALHCGKVCIRSNHIAIVTRMIHYSSFHVQTTLEAIKRIVAIDKLCILHSAAGNRKQYLSLDSQRVKSDATLSENISRRNHLIS